ncbi:PSF3 [Candida oxycetoniae]|uniref:DNA replication complex GINS protein PSF3 n=1 Tax=Candida oxycetoniae TaxID=497107 RepID=A0AAI9WYR5_9ASCO|nr:PSF3 [Candida oxycetoniae]KAI3405121.1 PSF3 [Candida oxycetoniae]
MNEKKVKHVCDSLESRIMGYYDLDDILADSEKLPCLFNHTIPGLGYLEGNPGKPIKENTKIELPIWLAQVLAVIHTQSNSQEAQMSATAASSFEPDPESTPFISLIDPEFINDKVKNAFKSDPQSLNLHKLSPQYYKMIQRWCSLFYEPDLVELIMNSLKVRSFEINNFASNVYAKHFNDEFIYTLEEFEKRLFKETSESHKLMRQWLRE